MKPAILRRFLGERGKALAVEEIKGNPVIRGNDKAAEELYLRGKIKFFEEGAFLVQEGCGSNEMTFIIAGKTKILVKGSKVAERHAGQHIGELALVDPSQPRSASVIAMEPTVGLIVSEEDFTAVASDHPEMWKQMAKEIAGRLRQRNERVRTANLVPIMFVACAGEAVSVARALEAYFDDQKVVIKLWTDNVFKPSKGTLESLELQLEAADFAVAIFSADDRVESRGVEKVAPRDNTIFELGLFAGAIGRERSFFAIQKGVDVKVPSDLAGITSLHFDLVGEANGVPEISEACMKINERIFELGPR